jgi:hypothetical protein
MAYTCNPSYLKAEIWRIVVGGQPKQTVLETLFPK